MLSGIRYHDLLLLVSRVPKVIRFTCLVGKQPKSIIRIPKWLFALCTLLSFVIPSVLEELSAQSDFHITQHYTQKDGLSNTSVFNVYEDSRGFLWIATAEGFNRFDGMNFKNYYHDKDVANGLPHNKVFDFIEYQPGLLLLGTDNGLAVLNTLTGRFENERIHAPKHTYSGISVSSIHQDSSGTVLINGLGEIDVFDRDLNYLYRLTDKAWASKLKGTYIAYEDPQTDRNGNLWLPTDTSGIQIIDFNTQTVQHKNNNPKHLEFLNNQFMRALFLDNMRNAVFVAPWGSGVFRYDLENGTHIHQDFGQPFPAEVNSVNALVELSNGNLLCNSHGHFFELDRLTLDYQRLKLPFQASTSKRDSRIYTVTMIKSREGHYWIGGPEGLFQLEEKTDQRELLLPAATDTSDCVDMLITATGEIYTMYKNGLLIETHLQRDTFASWQIPIMSPGVYLSQMTNDRNERLWIASTRGLVVFNMVTKQFTKPAFASRNLEHSHINTIFADRDGDIWIGTRLPFELMCYHHDTKELETINHEELQFAGTVAGSGRISGIAEDVDGVLWMRSIVGGGIWRHDKQNNSWTRFPADQNNYGLLGKKGVITIYPGGQDHLWVSTFVGYGLIKYDYKTDQVTTFSREDGLLSNHIQQIFGHSENLWLTTEYGVSQFNQKDNSIVSRNWFNVTNPFVAELDTLNDELILSMHGKQVFLPAHEKIRMLLPPMPVIDRIYVNHREQFIDAAQTALNLKHDQKNVSIDFTAPYFHGASKLRFAYILEGADQEWQYPSGTRTAQYAALSPGSYTFRIKVADPKGNWGRSINALAFTIAPPVWNRPWFLTSIAVTLATIAFLIGRKRLEVIRNASDLKQKIAETEMMALRAQMNPHFIFNSLNSIDALIHNDDKYQATLYLNKFAKLIRNVLDSSKQNTVTVEKDMETLRLYIELEQFRTENTFTSEIDIDPSILHEDIRVPPLIVQPYVENAILHGLRNREDDKGQLQIVVRRSNDGLSYIIRDNGVGIKFTTNGHAHEKVSYGMQMSSDRIKLFNKEEHASVTITDLHEHGRASGTQVEVKLKTA